MPTQNPPRAPGVGSVGLVAFAVAALASGAPAAVRAQDTWALDTLRSGFCVQFLVDPAAATKGLFRGAQPLPASRVDSLHPALQGVVRNAPEFAGWVPEQFCFYQFAATRTGGRELRDRKHGRPQAIAVWTMATAPGTPSPVVLFVNNSRLASSVKRLGISIEILSSTFGKVPESTDDRYEIRYDHGLITWDGHASGDSTAAVPLDRRWTVRGRNARPYTIRQQLGASGARRLVGALRIEGKGELARALTGSPIRFIGSVVWGSSGEISFLP